MEQTIIATEAAIAALLEKIDLCADIIKQLSGYSGTDTFKISFSVESLHIITFDITDKDVSFALSFFMAWHCNYQRQLREQRQRLAVLNCGKGLAQTVSRL